MLIGDDVYAMNGGFEILPGQFHNSRLCRHEVYFVENQ